MDLKVGEYYLCTDNVCMNGNPNDIWYYEGCLYKSEKIGCITNICGHEDHPWHNPGRHFRHVPKEQLYLNPNFKRHVYYCNLAKKYKDKFGAYLSAAKDKKGWFWHIVTGYDNLHHNETERYETEFEAWNAGLKQLSSMVYKNELKRK